MEKKKGEIKKGKTESFSLSVQERNPETLIVNIIARLDKFHQECQVKSDLVYQIIRPQLLTVKNLIDEKSYKLALFLTKSIKKQVDFYNHKVFTKEALKALQKGLEQLVKSLQQKP